jgi:hypothetical protein
VKESTSEAKLGAPDRLKYGREIPQIKMGIGEKKEQHKKRDKKS